MHIQKKIKQLLLVKQFLDRLKLNLIPLLVLEKMVSMACFGLFVQPFQNRVVAVNLPFNFDHYITFPILIKFSI